ncbi:hypothetical protein [Synechococcus sp. B60.1]|uniref:hypothetical protein n=1 Tax=unclassified Synechococcus TaxID=2626047 RepID=UPI0039C0FCA4
MNILRQYIFPALILLVFLFTLVVVSIRSFLPEDMAQPAPVEEATPVAFSALLMSEDG